MELLIYNQCIRNFQKVCAYSYATLGFGVIILILNIYAFIKMTIFYHKMKFENTLLLFSSIQSIVLIAQLMIDFSIPLLLGFIIIQIGLIFLINKKFYNISLGNIELKSIQLNYIILILDVLYIPGYCILYYFFYQKGKYNQFYINVFYYILEISASIFLSYHICKYSSWINKDKSNVGNALFYSIKKKQLSFLSYTNIIFSSLEFIIDIVVFLKYNFNFLNLNTIIYISIILFVFFLHNIVIFIPFYWIVRDQYSPKIKRLDANEKDIVKIIDNEFIKDIASSENENVERFIYDEKKNNKLNNTFDSFEIINVEEKENNNRRVSRTSNFDDEELISEKINKNNNN